MTAGPILVSGASGPIGAALILALKAHGYKVVRLVRRRALGDDELSWDPEKPLAADAVSGFFAVIHLAGETIAGRWTAAKKRRILESRRQGTRHLARAIAHAGKRPAVFISASAIGYYGDCGDRILGEDSASGHGFLAEVVREWEAAAQSAVEVGIRTVFTRFGIMLSAEGGALPQMLLPFRLGVGGRIGSGAQWWSWIHINDLVGGILHSLSSSLEGPVNLVAEHPVTNAEFTKVLARVLSRPAIFPVPAVAVRFALGQMGEEVLLASQRVEPRKLLEYGYKFEYSDLLPALREILEK
jgi:uncharacterized protein (TIGR01777 family)